MRGRGQVCWAAAGAASPDLPGDQAPRGALVPCVASSAFRFQGRRSDWSWLATLSGGSTSPEEGA